MKRIVILLTFFLGVVCIDDLSGQVGIFSKGKNLHQLQQTLAKPQRQRVGERPKIRAASWQTPPTTINSSSVVFLPRWNAETLPFFCRIEHQWAKQHRIPLKFRLGSVEYVDWLEGK
jgi:hypothetical protein